MKKFEIYLYGIIGNGQNNGATKFINEHTVLEDLKSMPTDAEEIHVRMKSPGGSVDSANAIVALLRSKDKRLVGHIDGLAASAMTLIASEMDYVIMSDPGRYMIHNPMGGSVSDGDAKRKEADELDAVKNMYIASYQRKSKQAETQIAEWMKAETWFTAQEALKYGFVDEVKASSMKVAACAADYAEQLKAFQNTPDELTTKENDMKNIIAAVGLSAEADETAVIAKFNDLKANIEQKTELIGSLTAKVGEKEKELTALKAKEAELIASLAKFQASDVRSKVQKETGYIVGAEVSAKLDRRIERYLAQVDETEKADAYEDLKAYCIANGVKAGEGVTPEGERTDGQVNALIVKAEALAKAEKITVEAAYMKLLSESKGA